ncbi:YIP1 family protein [Sulfitobacter sp. M57]|uniref:YIP1 family protein n=1 Tax=unclassified Sulfitobacter TaxID=196795 RepID=UPI0023E23CB6|nr:MULTISPECIES: YIP1 family protein [unclassified Sulfitobacter]MDF3413831.1 YIP1 family protein [Sulfitobacter sp. KE5]MDF3420888.1 YIP1 family protein [Sulfitobacter sp. KE43]MDF3432377.1 YIP1 family protein [Sulfitobacter sp. KE42]MDF3458016.1 YIP1 family protein [Sulfitobacter sp. S74]MDF3461917.1 YIP1 family protein [Sulfitobacter sp. Ks18]
MRDALVPMVQTSLRNPRGAARLILAMNLGRDALWTALALVAAVNTFLVLLIVHTSATPLPLPGYFEKPLTLFVLIAGLMVVYIHAMYWAGLVVGGKGGLMDVLAVVVWFQVLRAMAQAAVVLLSLAIPPLGGLLSLVVAVWGLWIFLSFLAEALNLRSLWHAVAALCVASVGLVLGLAVLIAIIGGAALGVVN